MIFLKKGGLIKEMKGNKYGRTITLILTGCIIVLTVLISANVLRFGAANTIFAASTTYYVDSIAGNDSNNGISQSTPWKTLNIVNTTTFQPGDRILLKAGSSWSGELHPLGTGASGNPIKLDMYGTGSKPIINGGGIKGTVHLLNQQYWEINNLEVTNDDNLNGDDTTSARSGILIEGSNFGTINYIHITNCYIHDVDGNQDGDKSTGGIIAVVTAWGTLTKFNDLLIEGNTIRKVDRTGIKPARTGQNAAVNTNVVVRNNYLEDIGGDGILMRDCISSICEYNVLNGFRRRSNQYNAGIWPWACTNALFQYNEAYNGLGTSDGMGFDCDYRCDGTTFQYNFSHDNDGGFILLCSPDSDPINKNYNSVVRYNISQNDRERIIEFCGPGTRFSKIYNNVIYVNADSGAKIIWNNSWGGVAGETYFYNNIFYALNGGSIDFNPAFVYDFNCYYGVGGTLPYDQHKIVADPKFFDPGKAISRTTAEGYRLLPGSPCINAGMVIANNGGKDYWGNSLYNGTPDIGAHEYQGNETYGPTRPPLPSPTPMPFTELLEAENYTNQAGFFVTRTQPDKGSFLIAAGADVGDCLDYYVNVPQAGNYQVVFRYSNPRSMTERVRIIQKETQTVLLGLELPMVVKDGWEDFGTVSGVLHLNPGVQTLRVFAVSGWWNLDWMRFTLTSQPVSPPLPEPGVGVNKVLNPGLETGTSANWNNWNGAVDSSSPYSGSYNLKIGPTDSSMEQVIFGLKPNTNYILSAMCRVQYNGDLAYLGVEEYGGNHTDTLVTGTRYTRVSRIFTTGPKVYSAKIFYYKTWSGSGMPETMGYAYADEFSVTEYTGPMPTTAPEPSPGANVLQDPYCEKGCFIDWKGWATAGFVKNNQLSGRYCLRIGVNDAGGLPGSFGSFEQTLSNLTPGATYQLTGWLKVDNSANSISLGVKNYGGAESSVYTSSTAYTQIKIDFTLGQSSTCATVFLWKPVGVAPGYAYGDNFFLVMTKKPDGTPVQPLPTPPPPTMPPLPDMSGPGLGIDNFNSSVQWNNRVNDLNQSIVTGGPGIFNPEADQDLYFFFNGVSYFDEYLNRDISQYTHLIYNLIGQDGGEETFMTIILNDGVDHPLPLQHYAYISKTAYQNFAIPLADFGANLKAVKYIRTLGESNIACVRLKGIRLTSPGGSVTPTPGVTVTPTPTTNPTVTPTSTPTPTPTLTPTPTPTPLPTPTPTSTPTPMPTSTPTPTPTTVPGVNFIVNPGFEAGTLSPWILATGNGGATQARKYTGSWSGYVGTSLGRIEQVVTGLTPNTTYTLSGWFTLESTSSTVQFGVKNYGGTQITKTVTTSGSFVWVNLSLSFTTGATNTTAIIFFEQPTSGGNYGYSDNWSLVAGGGVSVTPTPTNPPATATPTPTRPPATATPTPTMPPATATPTPTVPPVSLMIDDYNSAAQWNSNKNDLNQNIIKNGGNYNLENETNLYFSYNGTQSFDNYLNRSISSYSSLAINIKGRDGGEQTDLTIILNDGVNHSLALATYGTVTTSYRIITVPLSAFNANLANAKYLRIQGTGINKVIRIEDISLR